MACTTYCYRNPLRTKLAYRLHHHGRLFRAREMSSGPSHFPSLFPGTTSGYTYKGDGRVFFCAPRLRLDSLRTLNLDASSGIAHCASISLPFHLSPNCIIKCPTLHCIGCLTASLTSPPHPTTRFRYLKKKSRDGDDCPYPCRYMAQCGLVDSLRPERASQTLGYSKRKSLCDLMG